MLVRGLHLPQIDLVFDFVYLTLINFNTLSITLQTPWLYWSKQCFFFLFCRFLSQIEWNKTVMYVHESGICIDIRKSLQATSPDWAGAAIQDHGQRNLRAQWRTVGAVGAVRGSEIMGCCPGVKMSRKINKKDRNQASNLALPFQESTWPSLPAVNTMQVRFWPQNNAAF